MKTKHLIIAFISIITLAACSSDDNNPTSISPIVGTWKYIESGEIVEGTNLDAETKAQIEYLLDAAPGSNGEIHYTFNSDGTGIIKHFENNEEINFTYVLNGDNLTLNALGEESETIKIEIENNKLKLIITETSSLPYYQSLYPNAGLTRTDTYHTYQKI